MEGDITTGKLLVGDAPIRAALLRRSLGTAFLYGLAVVGAILALSRLWQPEYAARWALGTVAVLIYLFKVLLRGLGGNRASADAPLFPTLGAANHLTLLRGAMIAALVGFLIVPRPPGLLDWAPAVLYTLACFADFFDGFLARITGRTTRLGESLDMSFDGVGVLAASLLVVAYGQAPAWYLIVALARYIFLAGLWLRRRRGQPVYDLPPSFARRALAGVQMGFTAGILWPIFHPPGTHLAAALFTLPFLANFGRDWLYVSGRLRPVGADTASRQGPLSRWLPVALRVTIGLAAVGPLWARIAHYPDLLASYSAGGMWWLEILLPALIGLEALVVALVVVGAAGRTAAIVGLGLIGIHQPFVGLPPAHLVLLLAYSAILFLGTGHLSLWKPEEWLINHHAGEKSPPPPGSGEPV